MKLIGTILLANAVEAKIVRTPGIRAQRNQRFLATWFDNNCVDDETGTRPKRCHNWRERFLAQWDRMNNAFERNCGFFDESIPEGGPPPKENSRKRREVADDYEDYYEAFDGDYESLFDEIDFTLAEEDETTNDYASAKSDYWDYFAAYASDFADPDLEYETHGFADEDNVDARTVEDLVKLEKRKMSNDPGRALRQLTNAMKQFCKRYISECGIEKNDKGHSKRIRKHYKQLAIVHELVADTTGERARRIRERDERKLNAL